MNLEKSTPTTSPAVCKLDGVHSILNVLSLNIEDFMSNKFYLDMLMKRVDIMLLQEHWLTVPSGIYVQFFMFYKMF